MMLPYPNKIQDFWVFGACSLLQKLIPTALNMEPPTVAAFVGHVSCAKKNSDMFQLAAIPAPDSENVWLPTFHDLADRVIRVVTLLKKTRLKTHDFFASKMPCIGRNGPTARKEAWRKSKKPWRYMQSSACLRWENDEFSGHVRKNSDIGMGNSGICYMQILLRWECFQGVLRLQFSKPSRNVRVLFRLMEVSTFFCMA